MILKRTLLPFFIFFALNVHAQKTKPVDVVEASLKAYNSVDIDVYMSYFSEDIEMKDYDNGKINAKGKAEVLAIFEAYFKASPNLNSKVIDRLAFDNKVMDHQHITKAKGSKDPFEIVIIYEVLGGKITSMLAVRKSK